MTAGLTGKSGHLTNFRDEDKQQSMKVRLKKLDIIFSQLIRERNNYYCQACCENKREGLLDCAHIFSRRSVSTRWLPQNATALCRSCHIWFTERPFDWADWCRDQFGEDRISELRKVNNETVKWPPKLREEIYQFYKGELKEMEAKRLYTNEVIDFKPHEVMYQFNQEKDGESI